MKTIGSHPGAMLFRFTVTVIVILILIRIFLNYAEDTERGFERQSILQTERIIDSSLAVVFSTYAVKRRLADLNELDGANPFEFLAEYQMLPEAYQGTIERDVDAGLAPGWYYLAHRGVVAYRPRYLAGDRFFRVRLEFDDLNGSGRFEPVADRFRRLHFVALADT